MSTVKLDTISPIITIKFMVIISAAIVQKY